MYTIDDFKNGKVIINNNTSRNPSKVREILGLLFPSGCKASGNANYYVVDSVLKDWIASSTLKSFEALPVQSINDFETSDRYKSGDWVVVKSCTQCGEGNGIYKDNHIGQLRLSSPQGTPAVSGMLYGDKDVVFEISNGQGWCRIANSHIIRKAEENEISNCVQKLSIGDTYNFEGQHRIISRLDQYGVYFAKDIKGNPRDSFTQVVFFKNIKEDPRYTNYKSILLINNNNQNEQTGKTSTVNSGQRTESGISSSSTRQIASASRLVGDSAQSKCKKTRIGRIEISRNAISF